MVYHIPLCIISGHQAPMGMETPLQLTHTHIMMPTTLFSRLQPHIQIIFLFSSVIPVRQDRYQQLEKTIQSVQSIAN